MEEVTLGTKTWMQYHTRCITNR